jgi:hypothetical protein
LGKVNKPKKRAEEETKQWKEETKDACSFLFHRMAFGSGWVLCARRVVGRLEEGREVVCVVSVRAKFW